MKWTDARLRRRRRRTAADGRADGGVDLRRPRGRLRGRRARRSTKRSSCSPPATSRWRPAARWPTGRTASSTCTARRRAWRRRCRPSPAGSASIRPRSCSSASTPAAASAARAAGAVSMAIPALLVEEGQRAGDDAHQPRGGALHRPRAHQHDGPARRSASPRTAASRRSTSSSSRTTGPYGPMGDHRSAGQRGVARLPAAGDALARASTCSPTRRRGRSSARPGPMQANAIIEPVITKAAKQLGIDQVEIRRINAPAGKALYGPVGAERPAPHIDQRVRQGGARPRRASSSDWDERKARCRPAPRLQGARRRRRRRAARVGLDRLRRPDDDPARRQALRPVGRRQPRHAFGDRSRARGRRRARDALGQGRRRLGRHEQGPAVDVPVGRQPDDARDDARELRRRDGREAQAAGDRGAAISAARPTTTSWATSACSGAAIRAAA